jgi:hypothetical protein
MKHVKLLIILALLLSGGGMAAEGEQLLERLRINHAAMVAAEQDFHEQRQRGSLNGTEAADYATYIAGLHRLVAEDCQSLARAGLPLPEELGCQSLPPLLAPAALDLAGEQTLDEQIALLDAELSAGLGEFDERLLREQERVKGAAPMADAAEGGGGGAGDAGTGDAGAAAGAEGENGEHGESGAEPDDGAGGSPSAGDGAGAGAQRRSGGKGTPPDIPDGSDDDVVARQLREAAEKETDPELKKKLWEEYRKYKQGTR